MGALFLNEVRKTVDNRHEVVYEIAEDRNGPVGRQCDRDGRGALAEEKVQSLRSDVQR